MLLMGFIFGLLIGGGFCYLAYIHGWECGREYGMREERTLGPIFKDRAEKDKVSRGNGKGGV